MRAGKNSHLDMGSKLVQICCKQRFYVLYNMSSYLCESFIPNLFENLEEPSREVVHFDGLRQGLGEEFAIVRHFVHQFVQNRLRIVRLIDNDNRYILTPNRKVLGMK